MNRPTARKGFDTGTRLALLEGDTDRLESVLESIQTMMQRVIYSLVTATITFGVTAILLAFDIVISR